MEVNVREREPPECEGEEDTNTGIDSVPKEKAGKVFRTSRKLGVLL